MHSYLTPEYLIFDQGTMPAGAACLNTVMYSENSLSQFLTLSLSL